MAAPCNSLLVCDIWRWSLKLPVKTGSSGWYRRNVVLRGVDGGLIDADVGVVGHRQPNGIVEREHQFAVGNMLLETFGWRQCGQCLLRCGYAEQPFQFVVILRGCALESRRTMMVQVARRRKSFSFTGHLVGEWKMKIEIEKRKTKHRKS